MNNTNSSVLVDTHVDVKWRLFALWSSAVFFYIYGDYFEFYQPGKLKEMLAGTTVFGPVSQQILLGMAAIMVVPCLMPFLSLALPARVSRWLNVASGTVYTVAMILAIQGGWHFYIAFGLIEITLTSLVVWYAWTWPREPAH